MMNRKCLVLLLGLIFLSCERLLGQTAGMSVGQRPTEGMVMVPVVVGKVVDSTTRKALDLVVVDLVKLGEKGVVEGGLTDTAGVFKLALKSGLGRYVLKLTAVDYRDWETDRKSTRLNSSHRL